MSAASARVQRLCKGFVAGLVLLCAASVASDTHAGEPRHGLSSFGQLKYPHGFAHFDYVDPGAPKGGQISLIGSGGVITFDSFNAFILKGDKAQGGDLLYDSLMARAEDEPDAMYGLVAETAEVADDKRSVTFRLRADAKFADGSPVEAADVAFSFETLKSKGHPSFRSSLADVVGAEVIDTRTVRFSFKGELVRDLPLTVAALPVLPKAYYAARNFEETTLDRPLGSGPYRIGDFKPGTFVRYERRPDYWARDLAVNRGRHNFDTIKYEYYRDRTAELVSLKAGAFDFREEFTSIDWATAYDIPAVRDGRLVRETLPDETPSGAQGFFINTRREKFKDARVREALSLAFDFEWTNKNLFFELYTRTASYFENSSMKATGVPTAAELLLLEPFRDRLPATVFGEAPSPPVTDGSGSDRKLLRRASQLLDAAGWVQNGPVRSNAKGEPLGIEILIFAPSFERIIAPYLKNLKAIGIDANLRRVDPAQYERRVKEFDFDIVVQRYSMRLTPGVELKNFWGSAAAATDGSFNLAGIADPAVDAMIEKAMVAATREQLETALKAADRVLRAGHYWVPHWYKAAHNLVYWNKFSKPAVKPKYARGAVETWWYDAGKAKLLTSQ